MLAESKISTEEGAGSSRGIGIRKEEKRLSIRRQKKKEEWTSLVVQWLRL